MKLRKRTTIFLFCLFAFSQASAQSPRNVASSFHAWYVYAGEHRLAPRFNLTTEFNFRRADMLSKPQQNLIRIIPSWNLNDRLGLGIGWLYVMTYPYGEQPVSERVHEYRMFQVVTYRQNLESSNIHHRGILEQRFAGPHYAIRHRIRYRLAFTQSLVGKPGAKGNIFGLASDEIFIGLGNQLNVFEQNRLLVAAGFQISPQGRIQLGYMNQYMFKANGRDIENNHTLYAAVFYNLDFVRND